MVLLFDLRSKLLVPVPGSKYVVKLGLFLIYAKLEVSVTFQSLCTGSSGICVFNGNAPTSLAV